MLRARVTPVEWAPCENYPVWVCPVQELPCVNVLRARVTPFEWAPCENYPVRALPVPQEDRPLLGDTVAFVEVHQLVERVEGLIPHVVHPSAVLQHFEVLYVVPIATGRRRKHNVRTHKCIMINQTGCQRCFPPKGHKSPESFSNRLPWICMDIPPRKMALDVSEVRINSGKLFTHMTLAYLPQVWDVSQHC